MGLTSESCRQAIRRQAASRWGLTSHVLQGAAQSRGIPAAESDSEHWRGSLLHAAGTRGLPVDFPIARSSYKRVVANAVNRPAWSRQPGSPTAQSQDLPQHQDLPRPTAINSHQADAQASPPQHLLSAPTGAARVQKGLVLTFVRAARAPATISPPARVMSHVRLKMPAMGEAMVDGL